MKKSSWEHFPHQADMGIRGLGSSVEEAFEQAAISLTAVITEPEKIEHKREVQIELEEADLEILFVAWLSSLIYEMDTRKMLFGKFKVNISGNKLTANLWGENIDIEKHQPRVEVKGASYTELCVRKEKDGRWLAQCVVDV